MRVPALGIHAVINDPGSANMDNPEARASAEAYAWFQSERAARQIALFQRDLPQARLVRIERADHYVFLSNENEVLKELNAFIANLPKGADARVQRPNCARPANQSTLLVQAFTSRVPGRGLQEQRKFPHPDHSAYSTAGRRIPSHGSRWSRSISA